MEVERLRSELERLSAALATKDAELDAVRSNNDTLRSANLALHADVEDLQAKNATLASRNQELLRLVFGPKSERRVDEVAAEPNAWQGWLWAAELAAAAELHAERTGSLVEIQAHTRNRQRNPAKRRKKFPGHLPVLRTIISIPEDERLCCGQVMAEIGTEVRRELERIEFTLVHEIHCTKFGCRICQEGVRTAPAPPRVIDKGILGVGFLAHLITERFGNHMPYHRLEKKYASEGLDLSRVVLCDSALRCSELLEPLWKQMRTEVLEQPVIHTDETPVKMQSSSMGRTCTGRVWIYLDHENRHVYDFTESRSRDGPESVLGQYTGYIQADAASTFDGLFQPGGATEVACWSHARRYFVRAESSDPDLAREAKDRIRELFMLERELADLDPEERRRLREEHARPRLEALRAWMDQAQTQVLPQSPMAKAIQYCANHWEALVRYLEDGRLRIDNNAAERALRTVAVGRKNWMQIGSPRGGHGAAILYSLVMTCKAIGVNPAEYFRDVLLRIAECSDVAKLTPHGWKEHFAKEVRARRDRLLAKLLGSPPQGELQQDCAQA